MIAILAEAASSTTETAVATNRLDWPLVVAILGALGAAIAAATTFALTKVGDAAARRQTGYAEAAATLVAWAEYPYRIRRRTSDSAETLTALADAGHALQQRLRCAETWVICDSSRVGAVWAEVRVGLAGGVGDACKHAWDQPPVSAAGGMNVGAWGPSNVEAHLLRFERAAQWRFGWRRLIPGFRFTKTAKEQPAAAAHQAS